MQKTNLPSKFNKLSLDDIYRQNARAILTFVRHKVDSLEDAEDIVLDVFVAALDNEGFYGLNEHSQQKWLRRVASNKCIDYYRRNHRRSAITLDAIMETVYDDDEREPDQLAMQQEEYSLLRQRLTLLIAQQQQVLRLKFHDNLRSSEIARQMNKSEGSVRMMLARALNCLRSVYTGSNQKGDSHE